MKAHILAAAFLAAAPFPAAIAAPGPAGLCGKLVPSRASISSIDHKAAIPVCRDAVKADPDNGALHLQLGRALDAAKDYAGARRAYLAAANRGVLVAMNNLASMMSTGQGGPTDYSSAERWLRRAAASGFHDSENDLAWLLYRQEKDLAEAESFARKAVAAEPSNPNWLDTLGSVRLAQGKYAEAAGPLEKSIRIDSTAAGVRERLGDAYLGLGRKDEALKNWKLAIKLDNPDFIVDPDFDRKRVEDKIKRAS